MNTPAEAPSKYSIQSAIKARYKRHQAVYQRLLVETKWIGGPNSNRLDTAGLAASEILSRPVFIVILP